MGKIVEPGHVELTSHCKPGRKAYLRRFPLVDELKLQVEGAFLDVFLLVACGELQPASLPRTLKREQMKNLTPNIKSLHESNTWLKWNMKKCVKYDLSHGQLMHGYAYALCVMFTLLNTLLLIFFPVSDWEATIRQCPDDANEVSPSLKGSI